MLTVSDAFVKFKSRLEITPTEQVSASRRQKRLREQIRAELALDPKTPDFLTGSYRRDTKTKPLKDVDIFFVLSDDETDYLKHPPKVILERFQGILTAHYGQHRVTMERRSVRVDFGLKVVDDITDEIMNIDAVPAFPKRDFYLIPDTVSGKWISTNPRVHAEKATDANESFDLKWKPIVKMIKKWNDHNGKPVKPSFLLELMALKILIPPWQGSYPREIRQFFATAVEQIDEEWPDPARFGPPVSDRLHNDPAMLRQAKTALRMAERKCTEALNLEREGRNGAALVAWQELFGPLFVKS